MPAIEVTALSKTYRVAQKDAGIVATLRHFVRRRYREVQAVRDLSFAIDEGEMVGFLGPNGAGKTTALKMLSGLIRPSGGKVVVAGHDPFRRERSFLHRITLVMGQKQQLIWDLPARDSLRINAAVYGIDEAEAARRVDELAEMLDLQEKLSSPVRKLSLGERMKAELLAALLHRPAVLFLDEPTLGLDVNAQAAVRQFLREYNQRYGATMLLTSHYMADITALCSRVLLIHEGVLQYDGGLAALSSRFAPYRQVKIELKEDAVRDALAGYGEVESIEGRIARFLVGPENLTNTVSRLVADFDVEDLTVTDPPIEDVISRAFAEGKQ